MPTDEDLSSNQERAYELIVSRGGLTQAELWKELDTNSRTGSRIANALAEKGLIDREETLKDGRTTYLLTPKEEGDTGDDDSPEASAEPAAETEPPVTPEGNEPAGVTGAAEGERGDGEIKPREERALSLIQEQNGIYQSEFWKELDVSSRTGSRIASNLEEKGLIQREETTYNGQRTYLLLPAKEDVDFSLLMAGDEISPLVGAEESVDPIESPDFSQWVLNLIQEDR